MEWVLSRGKGSCSLQGSTAAAAARSGDLGRLRWLHGRGCDMGGYRTVEAALAHADLAVAQWLVDEAGCRLPEGRSRWYYLFFNAARRPGHALAKVRWLQERGAPAVEGNGDLVCTMARVAAARGQLELMGYLVSRYGPGSVMQPREVALGKEAAASGSIAMVQLLRQAGLRLTHEAYLGAAGKVHLPMIRWLACEAGVSASGLELDTLIDEQSLHGGDMLQAVQLVVEEAGCTGWKADGNVLAVRAAARRGDLALVQYLLQHTLGHRPDWDVLVAAAEGGCEALLEWLVQQHPGCSVAALASGSPYLAAARNSDRATLTALRRLGVPWGAEDVVARAVACLIRVPVLRWLVEQGAPVGSREQLEKGVVQEELSGRLSGKDAAWLRGLAAGHEQEQEA